jgi:hypothetical protein
MSKPDKTPQQSLEEARYHLASLAVDVAELALGEGAGRELPPALRERARTLATEASCPLMPLVELVDDASRRIGHA